MPSTNPTKWSSTLRQFIGKLPTNCLSVIDHFVGLARKWLNTFLLLLQMVYLQHICSEAYLEPSRTSAMEFILRK